MIKEYILLGCETEQDFFELTEKDSGNFELFIASFGDPITISPDEFGPLIELFKEAKRKIELKQYTEKKG